MEISKISNKTALLLLLISVVLISGCVESIDVANIAKETQAGMDFLAECPNAEIRAVRFSEDVVEEMIDEIREDCDPSILIKAYWKVTFYDPDTDTEMISWIDADTHDLVCFIKKGGDVTTTTTAPITTTTTTILNQTCEESDGGINYYVKGTVNPCPCYEDVCPACGIWIDKCLDEFTLLEYSCDNLGGEEYVCPYGCENGACLATTTSL